MDEESTTIEGGISDTETGGDTSTSKIATQKYSYVTTAGYLDLNFDLKSLKRQRLFAYMEAEKAILLGAQSYTLDNRQISRADLSKIQAEISKLIAEIAFEESLKNGNTRRVTFVD